MSKAITTISIDGEVKRQARELGINISQVSEEALRNEIAIRLDQVTTEKQKAMHLQKELRKVEEEKAQLEERMKGLDKEVADIKERSKKELTKPLEYYGRPENLFEVNEVKALVKKYAEYAEKNPNLVYRWFTETSRYDEGIQNDVAILKRFGITGKQFFDHLVTQHEKNQTAPYIN